MTVRIGEVPATADVVVIGSGFGGSVVAEKLAREGKFPRVCVVERGKAYPPGSFPRTPGAFTGNFWDPSEGLHGLFDVWSLRGLEAIVASGVGGGSLIYANVMLRKPEEWFCQPHPYRPGVYEHWSFDRTDLDPHYTSVEKFLGVQKLPDADADGGGAGLDPAYLIPKVQRFRRAGTAEVPVHYAPLAVRFRDANGDPVIGAAVPNADYPNMFGVPRRTCRLCGECDVGCNEGSKSSMDHTYLSSAIHHGATVHQRTEVRSISRDGDEFIVGVVVHDPKTERTPGGDGRKIDTSKLKIHPIRTRQVVLAAGTFGTSYLMLRNQDALGIANPALGTRFCGNGDLLGFILNVGQHLEGWKGPVISSYLEYPGTDEGDYRMLIQDAGYPEFAAWLVESALALKRLPAISKAVAGLAWSRLRHRDTGLSGEFAELLGNPRVTVRGMPVLGMGMDVPDGTFHLRKSRRKTLLDSTWSLRTSEDYFEALKCKMEAVACAVGGGYKVSPTYHLRRVISVHPLGGCPADTSESRGVVDSYGRVRGVPGLWVCDGSVFPGPVGANPSLTIAAFADRAAGKMASLAGSRSEWPEVN